MENLPQIDTEYLLQFLIDLLNIPSPTGYTEQVVDFSRQAFTDFSDLEVSVNHKGALVARWEVETSGLPRAVTAHVDTLGAMVKEIKSNGRLELTKIGGYTMNTIEGEGCTVFTRSGETVRGSYLLNKASSHVHGSDIQNIKRLPSSMEVRLDRRTASAKETRALGIEVGDFVAFDPRVELNDGFLRSRHLDDKACVAILFAGVKALADAGLAPARTTYFHISNYEEVGHGASVGIPADVTELLTLDMAAIGEGQASDEFHATICVKDSGGPYHNGLNRKLRQLAEAHEIPYKVDIFNFYGSDGEATWRAGGDMAVSLIGPGIDASHNYERTHTDSLVATTRWLVAYLLSE